MQAYVIIDNKDMSVVGIFIQEQYAKDMLKILGDEKIDDCARFAYEEWTWKEIISWIKNNFFKKYN